MKRILSFVAGLLILVFGGLQSVAAQANHNCIDSVADWNTVKVQKKKAPDYWIDPKFTTAEQEFIKKAIEAAVDRIQEKDIWQEVSSSYGFAFPKSDTIFDAGFCNSIAVQRNLLFHQLFYLTTTARRDSPDKFPKIYIYHSNLPPAEGELGWVGYAYYNKVRIFWDFQKNGWQREGDFEIYLNQYFLRQEGIYKNENYWAGTVAHEMLHNLGHQHPEATDSTYNQFQINVLANVIRNFGFEATAGDMKYPVHACRATSTGQATAGGGK